MPGVGLIFFLIVTYGLSALRTSQERQQELVHFIVHDLRSPLTSVLFGPQTLQRVGHEAINDEQKTLGETALGSGERMLTLINAILDSFRLEQWQMPLQLSEVTV